MYESERLTPDHAIALTTCSWQADGPRHERGAAELTKEEEITTAGTRLRSLLALGKAVEDAHILVLQAENTRPDGWTGHAACGDRLILRVIDSVTPSLQSKQREMGKRRRRL